MTPHSFLKSIELNGQIQVCPGEMSLNRVEDICANSAATHVAQVKKAMVPVTLTECLGQRVPSQRLLAGLELLALVHMMIASELPVLELHEK